MFFLILNTTICILILLIINYILTKKKLLIDTPEFSHHKYKHQKIIPLSGGLFFVISYFIFSFIYNLDNKIILFLIPLLFVGIYADTKKDFSPKLRLVLQLIFIVIFIYFYKIKISSIDLNFFDNFLKNDFFNFFFVTFCLITVLNGHNFMDGLNGLVTGNLLLILAGIYLISYYNGISIESELSQKLFIATITCFIFFIFNLFGKCFLGDNGVYIFSLFISLLLISFIESSNNLVSPLIAATFLWYPAYENLFSILRRLKRKQTISKPDNLHLHILFKNYIIIKLGKKLNYNFVNSISGFLIILFLLPNLILSIIWFNSSYKLLYLIIFQIIIYIIIYAKLIKFKK